MLKVRKSRDRGSANHGWLYTRHTFSFADYHDPEHMGFRTLRVLNDDRVAPGAGFGTHPHRDYEIISYVVDGALRHKDSMGNGSVIQAGDVQRMTAGTGVTHSEYNDSSEREVHFLQIWIQPEQRGLEPSYEQKPFTGERKRGTLCLVASNDGRAGSITVHQDVSLYASVLAPGTTLTHELAPDRHAWVQVVSGALEVNGEPLRTGDGLAASQESALAIQATKDAEFLVFDLA